MELKELQELIDYNELDVLYKLIETADAAKKRTEQILKGNKSACVDVRKTMQDIRLLSEIIRDLIQKRKLKKTKNNNSKLTKAINVEKKRLATEEKRIKEKEAKRIKEKNLNE